MRGGRSTVIAATAALAGLGAACGEGAVPGPTEPWSVGPIQLAPGQRVGGPQRSLERTDGPRFSGLALSRLALTCSGALVVPSTLDPTVDGPAYLLTAGHCVLGIGRKPNDVLLDPERSWPTDSVMFRWFGDSPQAAVEAHSRRVVYATMKGQDLALVELDQTRFQLRARGVVPFALTDRPTGDDEEIAIAGHPMSVPAVLSACRSERRVPFLLEAPFHFFDVESNHCMGVTYGSSGSPVFSLATGKVVAVQFTLADTSPTGPCDLNAPCEAAGPGIVFELGTIYVAPVAGLAACFDGTGQFDLAAAGCPLDRGNQMQPVDPQYRRPSAPGGTVAFDLVLDPQGLSHYRSLVAPVGEDDCRDVSRYGPVRAAADAPSIQATVAGSPEQHLVCIQAGAGPDPAAAGWQDPTRPTMVVATVGP